MDFGKWKVGVDINAGNYAVENDKSIMILQFPAKK